MGVLNPSIIDSLIPGIFTRNNVSWIALQSLSEIRTAFPRLPVIVMGSCVAEVSSISQIGRAHV